MVAEPAERAHRAGEERASEHERDRQPERVDREEQGALEHRVRSTREHEDRREHRTDAGRGADREGAAEEEAGAAALRSLQQPGAEQPLGHGSSPMNAKPTTTSTKPAIFSSRNWSWKSAAAHERGAHAEQDEDRREAEDERDARDDDAPRRAGLPERARRRPPRPPTGSPARAGARTGRGTRGTRRANATGIAW